MCESLETTSKVTDDQEKMNNFFQQNKHVVSHWLAIHRWRPSVLREIRFSNSGEQTGTAHAISTPCVLHRHALAS